MKSFLYSFSAMHVVCLTTTHESERYFSMKYSTLLFRLETIATPLSIKFYAPHTMNRLHIAVSVGGLINKIAPAQHWGTYWEPVTTGGLGASSRLTGGGSADEPACASLRLSVEVW